MVVQTWLLGRILCDKNNNNSHMKHLLLIEDNDEIRENTAEILELGGYKVNTAENGKVGVEKALEHRP